LARNIYTEEDYALKIIDKEFLKKVLKKFILVK
jgi:hypothetical protein